MNQRRRNKRGRFGFQALAWYVFGKHSFYCHVKGVFKRVRKKTVSLFLVPLFLMCSVWVSLKTIKDPQPMVCGPVRT